MCKYLEKNLPTFFILYTNMPKHQNVASTGSVHVWYCVIIVILRVSSVLVSG